MGQLAVKRLSNRWIKKNTQKGAHGLDSKERTSREGASGHGRLKRDGRNQYKNNLDTIRRV